MKEFEDYLEGIEDEERYRKRYNIGGDADEAREEYLHGEREVDTEDEISKVFLAAFEKGWDACSGSINADGSIDESYFDTYRQNALDDFLRIR